MTLNDVKKILYRENPVAVLQHVQYGNAYYLTSIQNADIKFVIPVVDMADSKFELTMDSKLLNRWISEVKHPDGGVSIDKNGKTQIWGEDGKIHGSQG
jgi:hypothetical protein